MRTIFKRRAENNQTSLGNIDRVQESLVLEIGVDKGTNDAQLGQSQPDSHMLRLVLHEQGHTIAFPQTISLLEHARNLVGIDVEIFERPRLVLVQNARLVRMFVAVDLELSVYCQGCFREALELRFDVAQKQRTFEVSRNGHEYLKYVFENFI